MDHRTTVSAAARYAIQRPTSVAMLIGRRNQDGMDGLRLARAITRRWIERDHAQQTWPTDAPAERTRWKLDSSGRRVDTDYWADGRGGEVWSLVLTSPHDGDEMLVERTVVTITTGLSDRFSVHVTHGFQPRTNRIQRPPVFQVALPRLVSDLIDALEFTDGGLQLSAASLDLDDQLVAHIDDSVRNLPVLIVGDGIEVDDLAHRVAGVALVTRTKNDAELACRPEPGEVVIAWPLRYGTRRSWERIENHRGPGDVERLAVEKVLKATAFAVTEDPAVQRIRSDSVLARIRQNRTAAPDGQTTPPHVGLTDTDEFWTDYEAALAANDELVGRLAQSDHDLHETRARLMALEASLSRGQTATTDRQAGCTEVRTVADAVRKAATDFPGQLDIHPRVWGALEGFEYPKPGTIFHDLSCLAQIVALWQAGVVSGDINQIAGDEGLPSFSSVISDSAVNMYPEDYIITVDGEDLLLGPHFGRGKSTSANCYRAYLRWDTERRRVLIGWIGPHLRDGTRPRL
jgi:hypothetical protein